MLWTLMDAIFGAKYVNIMLLSSTGCSYLHMTEQRDNFDIFLQAIVPKP